MIGLQYSCRDIPKISLSKKDFYLREDVIFLNHGSYGARPKAIIEEQQRWMLLHEQQPVLFYRHLHERMRKSREALAQFLGAKPENLNFVANATYGVNLVAHALAKNVLKSGDEVLATDHEYGACKRAWFEHAVSRGINYVEAQIPIPAPSQEELVEIIWSKVTPKTKVLFISHISSPTGIRFPVEELCKRAQKAGIITLIDGAHTAGQIDLDLSTLGADMFTGNCHKWMCTPVGSAFLWASDEFKSKLTPLTVSWGPLIKNAGDGSYIDENEYLGTRDYSPQLSMPFSIKWMKDNDWHLIQKRSRLLKQLGIKLLTSIQGVRSMLIEGSDPLTMLGAVLLPSHVNPQELKEWLYDKRNIEVVVHKWLGFPILRFTAHAHTSEDDIYALEKGLRDYLSHTPIAKL